MRINTNLTAMNTFTQYTNNNKKIASSVAKLSSGSAINSAADNATGLAISEKMRAQIRGLEKASTNAQDAISLVQSAEGALSSSTEILQRMRELAVQSASDTNANEIDRTALQDEFSQLQNELNDIAKNTTFNKKNLLDGSLATQSKNLGATTLTNSGMTIQLGNAATGSYNFSVSTKLESAAVSGQNPNTPELVTDGAATYFSGTNSVALGANVAASDLLNGNYSLSAAYNSSANDGGDDQITVTATGDNGQSFEAKVSAADLTALSTGTTLTLNFNEGADDAFNITLGLGSTVTGSESNYDTLASNISKLSVSVTGGVTAKDAEYGVYANLTGAESIKLEAGMGSVTFGNGVKVNFDTLTASSVDTANDAITTKAGGSITTATVSLTDILNPGTSGATGVSIAVTDTNDALAIGNFTIGNDGTNHVTLTDNAGNVFTSNETTTIADPTGGAVRALTFDDADGSLVAGLTANLTYTTSGAFAANPVSLDLSSTAAATGNVAYALAGTGQGTMTMGNFEFADDSIVVNNGLSIVKSTSGGNTVFTATDSDSNTFVATVATADLNAPNGTSSKTTSLTFASTTVGSGFTADLTAVKTTNPNTDVTLADGTALTTAISGAGHNYTKVFGAGTDADLAVTTASTFSVEATANAGLTFQVGANEGDSMVINIEKMDANYLGVSSASVATRTAATEAIDAVDQAINQVSSQRAYLGAIQNRLEYKISNLNTSTENLTSAESQIRDVDMAKEMTAFTNANILNQASTAMLAQANSLPQAVLSLIGG